MAEEIIQSVSEKQVSLKSGRDMVELFRNLEIFHFKLSKERKYTSFAKGKLD